jgi:hypothetical protein
LFFTLPTSAPTFLDDGQRARHRERPVQGHAAGRRFALSAQLSTCKVIDHDSSNQIVGRLFFFGDAHLRRILAAYAAYYNEVRTHLALAKDAPLLRPIQQFGQITVRPILGGLHHQYCRI